MRLLIHASHDLALAQLRDASGGELDLHFHGSMENLAALSRGQCDLAGFHVAEQAPTPELSRWLKAGVHKLIGVAVREQGLMVARENPLRIQGLRDLVRSGVRMVNRQQGSGTRLVFDELLDAAGIERDRLRGYQVEEFTHLAVAATVASGMADAGFGIRAAAAQSGLGFIPLASERYLLACRGDRLQLPELRKFIALLRSARFGTILSRLPGYDNAITGRVTDVAHGLAGPRPARNAAPASK